MCRRLGSLALVLLLALSTTGCLFYAPVNVGPGAPPSFDELELVDAEGFFTSEKIAVIPINGTIAGTQDLGWLTGRRNMVADVARQLRRAREDEDVRAVVLTIDSPGGGVTASDQIWRELRRFRQRTGKPIVASLGDVAASGGYYVAAASDRIYAHPTTVTGSIGVITSFMNAEGLFEKVGLEQTVVKSGEYKDIGSWSRAMTAEEEAIYQGVVDGMFEQFVDVIVQGRANLTRSQVVPLADGRIYTAQQAKAAGLVDEIGYLDDAIAEAKALAGVRDANVVTYRLAGGVPFNLFGADQSVAPAPGTAEGAPVAQVDLGLDRLLPPPGGRFLYLWDP